MARSSVVVICRNPDEGFVVEQLRRISWLHVRIGILQHARREPHLLGLTPVSKDLALTWAALVSNVSSEHPRTWRANAVIKAVESSLSPTPTRCAPEHYLLLRHFLATPKNQQALLAF